MSNSNMSKTDDDIARTVDRLMKNKSRGSYDILNELRSKYDDEALISSIMNKYKEKMRRVKKIAEKIRERLLAKYPDLSQKEYIEKIYGYKKKYGFDDSELQAIINLVLLKKDGLIGEDFEPNVTEMSKALGFVPVSSAKRVPRPPAKITTFMLFIYNIYYTTLQNFLFQSQWML